jgi:GDP-L-fucose synthase
MKIMVAGASGMVGSALVRSLQKDHELIEVNSKIVDLTDRKATFAFLRKTEPEVVLDAAAKVGGILANSSYPVDFLSKNLQIQTNLFDASHAVDVRKLIFLGSSCIYPSDRVDPIHESELMMGRLEETNEAYAVAKIAGLAAVRSYRKQYNREWISLMPTNLYGPADNFDPISSHVLPALIRKFHDAKISELQKVTLWGTGRPKRELLHVDDLASATVHLLENYNEDQHINIGTGIDISISELAEEVRGIIGYQGEISWDTSKPDGTYRKVLDVSKLKQTGWKPAHTLTSGIEDTYNWYLDHC